MVSGSILKEKGGPFWNRCKGLCCSARPRRMRNDKRPSVVKTGRKQLVRPRPGIHTLANGRGNRTRAGSRITFAFLQAPPPLFAAKNHATTRLRRNKILAKSVLTVVSFSGIENKRRKEKETRSKREREEERKEE